jgi:hypothetical protein
MNRRPFLRLLALCALSAATLSGATLSAALAADAIYPVGSRLGLVPPPGMTAATTFPGFEDRENSAFIRLIALPGPAFGEIEKTMTNDALKKQGMTVEKRENFPLPGGKSILVIVRQEANAVRIRKWLLIAPLGELTALVSVELPDATAARYPATAVRKALTTLAARSTVPVEEQLTLVPFRVGELAGMRLVRVVPGVALQFTDGPKDAFDAAEQPHLVISVAPGGPQQSGDRDTFARQAMTGLPPFKDVRMLSSESMRIGGMAGHEVRAEGRDVQTGAEIEIVQWLRFGTGAYMRILGIAPKQKWTEALTRFRAVRDGLEPR